MDDDTGLVARTVRDFVASVASIDEPVPAGGSVAALTGAASAALLALVCGVLQRKGLDGVSELVARAQALQASVLALVDVDAEAYRAFLRARRPRGGDALERMSHVPLEIATACGEVVKLSHEVESHTAGPLLSDVRTARYLAQAAVAATLDMAEQDALLFTDPAAHARLRDEIAILRGTYADRPDAP